MYEQIGTYSGGKVIAEHNLCNVHWNPPGWGSCDVDAKWWPGAKRAQLIALLPDGVIPLHSDQPAAEAAIDSTERLHVVLQSNDECWNLHGGKWQKLEEGGIYRMDASKPHASINFGKCVRIHLVVDI